LFLLILGREEGDAAEDKFEQLEVQVGPLHVAAHLGHSLQQVLHLASMLFKTIFLRQCCCGKQSHNLSMFKEREVIPSALFTLWLDGTPVLLAYP